MCKGSGKADRLKLIRSRTLGDLGPETKKALHRCEEEILEGLKHGFFDFTISCEIIQGKKRRLILKAGKSYCFVIPEQEVNPD